MAKFNKKKLIKKADKFVGELNKNDIRIAKEVTKKVTKKIKAVIKKIKKRK